MLGPTPKQEALMLFMADYQQREGMPPTLSDMREFMRVRTTVAPHDMLKALERKGYVLRRPRIARGSTLTFKAVKFLEQSRGGKPA